MRVHKFNSVIDKSLAWEASLHVATATATNSQQRTTTRACPASELTLPTRSMEWWSAPPMRLKPHGRPPVNVIS